MYYEGRWEREYFEKQPKSREPSLWHLCPEYARPSHACINYLTRGLGFGRILDQVGVTYLKDRIFLLFLP
jgi:hypothetical protein